jgi:hypothetical protein
MQRLLLALAVALGSAAGAAAQPGQQYPAGPFYNPQNIQPNIYNPANQPLSPYLNLLRGGNTATNYYYGVRPGTSGGFGFGLGAPFTAQGGYRPPFFPQLTNAPDPFSTSDTPLPGSVFAPAGHPVVFNNTLGFFPSPYGNRGSTGRPGLAGVGTAGAARPSTTGR